MGKARAFLCRAALVLAAAGLLGADAGDRKGQLTVVVTGIESTEGRIMIALVDSEEAYDSDDDALRQKDPLASGERVSVTFEGLDYGTYALKIFHDANDNRKLDKNFIGLPKEWFGFSNNAMGRFGPPGFEETSFELDQPELTVEIGLIRF